MHFRTDIGRKALSDASLARTAKIARAVAPAPDQT
jgi:hypothetical protein